MKIFKFIIDFRITAFILLFSFTLTGASITSMEIVPVENQKILLLTVETSGSGNIDINIKNSSGRIIYSDQHQSLSSFVKKIHLNDVPNGDYTFELEDELFVNITPFTIDYSNLTVDEANSSLRFKPYIKWDNNNKKLDINWLLKEKGTFKVFIKDDEDKILHRSKIENKLNMAKRYSLTNIEKGQYQVTVINNDRSYSKMFEIN